jgi:hypothetical protein
MNFKNEIDKIKCITLFQQCVDLNQDIIGAQAKLIAMVNELEAMEVYANATTADKEMITKIKERYN